MAAFQDSRRYRPRRSVGGVRATAAGLGVLLLAVSAALILVGRIEPGALVTARGWIGGWMVPATGALSSVSVQARKLLSRVTYRGEPERLTPEAARAAVLQARVNDLEQENRDLRTLAHFARTTRAPQVAARVVMSSAAPLSQTLVIDAGRLQGIKSGFPVVAGTGLIGRIVHAQQNHASVMLLSDRLSRVPVAIGFKQARGVLAGTGTDRPRLEFIGEGALIEAGDLVVTSGTGGVFPRGLAVGIVVADGAGWRVELTAGRDDPLAVGILLMEGSALEPVEQGAAKADRPQRQAIAPLPEVK